MNDVEHAIDAVPKVASLSRSLCRREFDNRFLASRMAEDYVRLYELLAAAESMTLPAPRLDSSLTL